MKTKQLILTVLTLFIHAAIAKAQVKDTVVYHNKTYEVVREGDLTYLRSGNIMERKESIDKKGKTYQNVLLNIPNRKGLYDSVFQAVFSEERERQLAGKRLVCIINFSPVDNQIIHIWFILSRINEDDESPFKLSELDALEKKFRETPFPFDYKVSGEIIDGGERISIPYNFGTFNKQE